MTLTGLAADSRLRGRRKGEGSARRIAAVAAMLIGAVAGALLLKTSLTLPLAAAAALALLTLLVYVPAAAPGCDRRQLPRPEQGDELVAVDRRESALAQLHVGAGKPADLGGEVRPVTDQEHLAAPGGSSSSASNPPPRSSVAHSGLIPPP